VPNGRRSYRDLRLGVHVLVLLVTSSTVLLAQAAPSPAQRTLSQEEQAHFLATARIVSSRKIPKGVTRPVRLTLTDGTLTHDAAFSTVDERKPVMQFSSGRTELDFVDSYKFSIAAYRVARLLGLDDMVPVTIEREWRGQQGALAWWIDAKWDEAERRDQKLKPPDTSAWSRQVARMRIFEQLVADTDRNLGNILITEDWQLWMVDFTRAFRRTRELGKRPLTQCDRRLLERLRSLTREDLLKEVGRYLTGAHVDPLLERRDLIVARFNELIARRGEAAVLLD
jgi:hypothetical protein